jgi:hypothetical protein
LNCNINAKRGKKLLYLATESLPTCSRQRICDRRGAIDTRQPLPTRDKIISTCTHGGPLGLA